MMVLVDTSVWSLAFRRNESSSSRNIVDNLTTLIRECRAQITGPIRQELLSGIRENNQFAILKEKLSYFVDLPTGTAEYELAAEMFNICRKEGIQRSHIDFLICAVAYQNGCAIFTTDKDFTLYSEHLNIRLFVPEEV